MLVNGDGNVGILFQPLWRLFAINIRFFRKCHCSIPHVSCARGYDSFSGCISYGCITRNVAVMVIWLSLEKRI